MLWRSKQEPRAGNALIGPSPCIELMLVESLFSCPPERCAGSRARAVCTGNAGQQTVRHQALNGQGCLSERPSPEGQETAHTVQP